MTTIDKILPQALSPVTTSSLLKLAHHTMHGAQTWYACVFERFHDNHEQKMAWPMMEDSDDEDFLCEEGRHT